MDLNKTLSIAFDQNGLNVYLFLGMAKKLYIQAIFGISKKSRSGSRQEWR